MPSSIGHDDCEVTGNVLVDRQRIEASLDLSQRSHPLGSDLRLLRQQDPNMQLGDRDDGDGGLVGDGTKWTTLLSGDQDGGI